MRTVSHPEYGEIPLLRHTVRTPDGKEVSYSTYDLTYQPPLPKGAVRGDPTCQNYCTACNVPKYYFVDEKRRCVECERDFTFWAKEQKYWYETLGFSVHSKAIRCLECRKARRAGIALQRSYAEAIKQAAAKPKDPCALLALVEETVQYHREKGKVDLGRALAAVRKARKLSPKLLESLFWEGEIQSLAGRREKAREAYDRFIEKAAPRLQYLSLVKRAYEQRRQK